MRAANESLRGIALTHKCLLPRVRPRNTRALASTSSRVKHFHKVDSREHPLMHQTRVANVATPERIRNVHRSTSLAIAGLLFVVLAAGAGPRFDEIENGAGQVLIQSFSDGGGFVQGALGIVRNSASSVEKIRCDIHRPETLDAANRVTGRSAYVYCQATDVSGQRAYCTSTSEQIADMFAAMSDDAFITFQFDSSRKCTNVNVHQSSALDRKR